MIGRSVLKAWHESRFSRRHAILSKMESNPRKASAKLLLRGLRM